MADSENSRTLPSITRRNILSAAVISLPALAASPSLGTPFNDLAGERTDDPTLSLWRKWVTAHESYVKAHHLQWDLGTKLYGLTDGHEIEIHLPSRRATFYASTAEEIDDFLGGRPEMAEAYAAARDRLAALHIEWDEADERIGYSIAVEMEKKACDLRLKLAKTLWNTPAQSVTGAAAKLHSFIEMKTPVAAWRKGLHPALRRFDEPSWPELRSILADLKQIGGPDRG